MNEIQVLSEGIVSKIAAGEVIERPASVVKELIENSVDAQAKRIHAEIVNGGRQSIRISDDGTGMTRDDALLCAERHATSKMQSPTDLFTIQTLGFRGEALASIGAVSRMVIETCTDGEGSGSRISIEGGVRRDISTIARDVGTTVTVRSLFFNTPARRKFLRHIDTESRYITQAVVQLAAAYPAVAFRLTNHEREVLDLRSSERRERAAELLGVDDDNLLHASRDEDGIKVEALVCSPDVCRRTRGKQFTIVRERPIFSRSISKSLYDGYGGLLPHNCHPLYILWLDLDPAKMDVNVHPTKREVRFSEERRIVEVVRSAVRSALDMPETPVFTAGKGRSFGDSRVSERAASFEAADSSGGHGGADTHGRQQMSLSLLPATALKGDPLNMDSDPAQRDATLEQIGAAPGLWQAHNKYIVTAIQDGIAVIDQHVAHERVRYEEVLEAIDREGPSSQQLLFPLTLELSPVEMDAYKEAQALLQKIGFGVREFGPQTVIVDSTPVDLRHWSDGQVFRQIIGELLEELEARSEATEAVAASMACHTSIRAGERLSDEEMQALIQRLLRTSEPFVCPHGRPIILRIPLRELDRLFGRT